MAQPLDILIAVVGSHGDVHPFVGIGRGLLRRGHRVRVIVNPHFEAVVRKAGLEIIPLGTDQDYREMADHPDLWHPQRGPRYIFRRLGEFAPRLYQLIADNCTPGKTIVVHSTLAIGARVAQEKLGLPTATVHLQPAVIRSVIAPPVLSTLRVPGWTPRFVQRWIYAFADRFVLDPLVAPALNEFRASLGLPAVRNIVQGWWDSPELTIGLFPEWFAPPQADWPKQLRLTGFPLFDESGNAPFPAELETFLQSGPPPVAFTPGSAMWRGETFFAEAVKACELGKHRGVLLSIHADHIPKPLPTGVIHIHYAPFSQLLPRCAALVHHGGIGTTAQAMAAGTPQLIMPLSHDQPDNAHRVRELGIGEILPPQVFTANRIANSLARLIESPNVRSACLAIARRFESVDPVGRTCELIEELPRMANIAPSQRVDE